MLGFSVLMPYKAIGEYFVTFICRVSSSHTGFSVAWNSSVPTPSIIALSHVVGLHFNVALSFFSRSALKLCQWLSICSFFAVVHTYMIAFIPSALAMVNSSYRLSPFSLVIWSCAHGQSDNPFELFNLFVFMLFV
jgi:hypothetical protein